MDYLTPYLTKVKSAKSETIDFVEDGIEAREGHIRKLIKERWLLGNDPDGNVIGYYRSTAYRFFKQQRNPRAAGDVDLTLTGALGDGIRVHTYGTKFEIFSTDAKFDDIVKRYGDYNFNITDEEKEALFNEIGGEVLIKMYDLIWRV